MTAIIIALILASLLTPVPKLLFYNALSIILSAFWFFVFIALLIFMKRK